MNILKTLVLSALLAIFMISPAAAQDRTPTLEQVETHAIPYSYELARNILGGNFITPKDVAQARNLSYSDVRLAVFKDTLPSREVLVWLRANDYMLVAGPPVELSLLDIRKLNDTLFFSKNGKGWYSFDNETFSRNDTVSPVWLALRKSAVPDSTKKTWGEQQELLSNNERVPNAAEVTWGLTTYKEVRGVYLMGKIWMRTFSVDSGSRRVGVAIFDQGGIYINNWGDDNRDNYFGVSSVWKFLR